jgi:hypothetical protein
MPYGPVKPSRNLPALSVFMPLGLLLSASLADKVGMNQWFAISAILILGIA